MAHINPFKAVLPARDKVHLVASRSYITYSKRHLKGKLETNPFSFLHVINPDFFSEQPTKDLNVKYELVKAKYQSFLKEGVFEKDTKSSLYLYKQIKEGRTYSGIIGGADVHDYFNGVIKIHENTLSTREEMFKNYLKKTGFNAEPVLITHPTNKALNQIKTDYYNTRPEFDFTTTNRVRHQFWKIKNSEDIHAIQTCFETFESLYIADGHHRSASSSLLAKENGNLHNKENPLNYFMSMFIDENELHIYDYNRLIKGLRSFNLDDFLAELAKSFHVVPKPVGYAPTCCHDIGLYARGKWYSLAPKEHIKNDENPVEKLDAQIINRHILDPLLGIKNLKTDKRVNFIGGNEGKQALVSAVDSGRAQLAFYLYPVLLDEIKAVADAHQVMPPKSTWVEPKLRSGLTIYEL